VCRECEISPTAYYRWKNEARNRVTTALDAAKDKLIRRMGAHLREGCRSGDPQKRCWPQLRRASLTSEEVVEQGYEPNVVATALSISRSSLYYRNRPRCKVKRQRTRTTEKYCCQHFTAASQYGINRTTWTTKLLGKVMAAKGYRLVIIRCRRLSKFRIRFRKAREVLTSNDPTTGTNLGRSQVFFLG